MKFVKDSLILCLFLTASHVYASDISLSGFVQFDSMLSHTQYGDYESTVYLPNLHQGVDDGEMNFLSTARYSRIRIAAQADVNNERLKGLVEFDFNTKEGTEAVSNSKQTRLRLAYISYKNVVIGQTYSNLFSATAFPDTLDFVGPSESIVFIRQPILKFSKNNFSVSFENPESLFVQENDKFAINDDSVPDITF